MPAPDDDPTFEALANAVAARLAGLLPGGPTVPNRPVRDPIVGVPPGWRPPQRVEEIARQLGARVGLDGVEYTQSTQYNSLVTPRHDADNAVPLVAWKSLVARAYPAVRPGLLGGDNLTGSSVTGELMLAIGERVLFRTGPSRPAGARLGPGSSISRDLWDQEITAFGSGPGGPERFSAVRINCPLNFVVPAYCCRPGRVYAQLRLWPVDEGPSSSRAAFATRYLWFVEVQAPKVCLVRVNWTDANGNVNRPSDAAMLATLSLAERMLPFPYFDTTILGGEEESGAAFATAGKNGACNDAWTKLVTRLNLTRIFTALFQLGDIVYGMVPQAAIPPGAKKINSGCGIGAGGGFVGFEGTFAHEMGHLYGRNHVAVSGDPKTDTEYPKYGGSSRSIGEVGIDTGTWPPTLFDPKSSDDIMSYGNNRWISPYTYQSILDARGMHQSEPVDPKRLRPLFVLDFRLPRAQAGLRRVEIKAIAHVQAPGAVPSQPADAPSPVSIDLLDANRRILATHHCVYVAAHGGGRCACCNGAPVPLEREPWLDFTEVIESPAEDVAAIAFHDGNDPFQIIEVGEAPSVSIGQPREQDRRLTVQVQASHPRERVSLLVLFSADDGASWQLVAIDPLEGVVSVETERLPGGEACRFRAIASAELRSAIADTEPFALARKPRRLFLDLPGEHCPTAPGAVALAARFDNRGLGAPAPNEVEWASSLDGALGFGYALAPVLSEGRHEVTVRAPNGVGGSLAERGIIIVGGRPATDATHQP